MNDVVVIGAGLAGLTCARRLQAAGVDCIVLEAGDAVGGRVRTDMVDGFRLDRGFQVLLTAYPAARKWLDYGRLELKKFSAGALVWCDGGRHRVSDPWREPGALWATLRAPGGIARGQGANCDAASGGPARHVGRTVCEAGNHGVGGVAGARFQRPDDRAFPAAVVGRSLSRPGTGNFQPDAGLCLPDVRRGRHSGAGGGNAGNPGSNSQAG